MWLRLMPRSLRSGQFFDAEVFPGSDVVENAEDGLHGQRGQVLARVGSGQDGIVRGGARQSHVAIGRRSVRRQRIAGSHVRQDGDHLLAEIGR